MRRIFFYLAFLCTLCCAAQITTKSTYDVDGSGTVDVADVAKTVRKVMGQTTDGSQVVTAEDLNTLLQTINKRLKAIEEKLGIKEEDPILSLTPSVASISCKVGDNPVTVVFTAAYQSGRTEPVTDVTCTSTNQSVAKWENNKVTIGVEGSATLTFDYQGVKCAIAVNVSAATSEDPVDYIGWASTELSEVIGNESCKTSLDGDINLTSVPGFVANKVLLIASKEELTISQPGLGVFSFSDNQHGYYNDYYWYAIGPLKTNESIINVTK